MENRKYVKYRNCIFKVVGENNNKLDIFKVGNEYTLYCNIDKGSIIHRDMSSDVFHKKLEFE